MNLKNQSYHLSVGYNSVRSIDRIVVTRVLGFEGLGRMVTRHRVPGRGGA
jgi:hypothetical protein